mmetsp:Transcript_10987/g.25081  ORF Transcript_10987/g.25081 Transcript_10987/m.25081 type:complete len:482 (+) Transcript_10987:93-1538(+)|eukprot:CAMPEP_0178400654 /NCGR_PEP_ID=MMETSP0689_2-20121128/15900_1 /TAXON_ID=160604 /ORGANISM="Amphidinium massartii, Strain CS-259" /LENGTH=481 /DNA_ID=CAMNT_0020021455 /DNA_START=31 /DNA_END=1476 /DNA_ORIENTATION=-
MGCTRSRHTKEDSKSSYQEFTAEYTIGEVLGSGSFGQVRRAVHKQSGDVVAVKVLYIKKPSSKESLQARILVNREVDSWKKVGRHENIVHLHNVFLGQVAFLVMDICHSSILSRKSKPGQVVMSQLLQQMLWAIRHCHQSMVVHHDIKPDNFLWMAQGSNQVKLCDFGLAQVLPKKGVFSGVRAGTPPYMSPEMLKNEGHNAKTDIWSLGVTGYLLLFGHFPYGTLARNTDEMRKAIIGGRPPVFRRGDFHEEGHFVPARPSKPLALDVVQLIQVLLTRSQVERPTAEEALQHEAFQSKEEEVAAKGRKNAVLHSTVLTQAKAKASKFSNVDPTVQRELDELLQRLQPELKRSFTSPAGQSSPKSDMGHRPSDGSSVVGNSAMGTCTSSADSADSESNYNSRSLSRSSTAPVMQYGSGQSFHSEGKSAPLRTLAEVKEKDRQVSDSGTDHDQAIEAALKKLSKGLDISDEDEHVPRIRMTL